MQLEKVVRHWNNIQIIMHPLWKDKETHFTFYFYVLNAYFLNKKWKMEFFKNHSWCFLYSPRQLEKASNMNVSYINRKGIFVYRPLQ